MEGERVQRRLAAILAADVAGYSRLTGADEEGTIARLRALRRELIDPAIAAHSGRIVNTAGDSILVEFASAVAAVRCAVAIQRGVISRTDDMRAEKRIAFRIGVNVGDVVADGDDLLGDGVNIAARLESLAEPGGISISGTAYDQVRDKLPLAFTDTGEHTVKNIVRPVRVYALAAQSVAALAEASAAGETPSSNMRTNTKRNIRVAAAAGLIILLVCAAWFGLKFAEPPKPTAITPRLSIAVLPFTNLGGDPAQDYLADVITEELTTSLSRIGGTFVIARSTAFTYKGKPVDAKQVGRDLGVRYLLEGSEQQGGNRVRVNAQLIDAETGSHLWADQFDADRTDVLQMQDEIVKRLSRALEIQLVAVDAARVARAQPVNPSAEDLAMRCEAAVINSREQGDQLEEAYRLCERALQLDQRNVRALIQLSFKFIDPVLTLQSTDRAANIRRADELISRALAIDPNLYAGHFAKSELLLTQKRFEEAIAAAEHSLALNPSFVGAYSALCTGNIFLGRPEKAIEYADRAMRLSPRDPYLYVFYMEKGLALALLRQDEEAVEWLRRSVTAAPDWPPSQAFLAAELALNGQEAEARETIKQYLSLSGTRARTIAQWQMQLPSNNPVFLADSKRLMEGLRKAGLAEE